MMNVTTETARLKPWEELTRLAATGSRQQLTTFLDQLSASDVALAMSRLSDVEQSQVVKTLAPDQAADLVHQLYDVQAVELLEHLDTQDAAAILDSLPSSEQADLIGEMNERDAEAILDAMDPAEAAGARQLSQYDTDVAGGLMVTELLKYAEHLTVGDVVEDLREQRRQSTATTTCSMRMFAIDSNCLTGVLRLRDLLLAKRSQQIDRVDDSRASLSPRSNHAR